MMAMEDRERSTVVSLATKQVQVFVSRLRTVARWLLGASIALVAGHGYMLFNGADFVHDRYLADRGSEVRSATPCDVTPFCVAPNT
jgi:hypothetical protein